jgi:DNA-binding beta-propeller fold protein YncE
MPTLLLSCSHARALFAVLGNASTFTFLRNAIARAALMVLFVLAGAVLAGCGGSSSGGGAGLPLLPVTPPVAPPPPPGATYPVSGTVAGLQGSGLVLQNNAGDDLPVAADGVVRFAVPVAGGARYAVTVKAQPTDPAQTCTVNNGSGTVMDVAIADVAVVCSVNSYKVGGAVTGLQGGGLVLQNNAADDLAISADGTFEFTAPVASGAGYAVTVKTQPTAPSQTCTVNNAGATVDDADVKTVKVICATNGSYTVSGTVSGLRGRGLVLQNNAGDDLALSYSLHGTFSFTTPVAGGAGYAVTVKTQPRFPSQACTVGNGSGTVGSAAVTSVVVHCATSAANLVRFAYAVNRGSYTVSAYTIDAATGALSPMAGPAVPTETDPWSVAVDPTGRFAYVTNSGTRTVSAYTIDTGTGALSPMAGPAVATESTPLSITVHPTGRFAYVANVDSHTVSAYTIDAATGALSPDGRAGGAGRQQTVCRHRGPLGPVCLCGEFRFPHRVGLHHRCRHGRAEPHGRAGGADREHSDLRHRGPHGPVCLCGEFRFRHRVGLHHRCRHGRAEPHGRADGGDREAPFRRRRRPHGPICLCGELEFRHRVDLHHRCRHGQAEPDCRADGADREQPFRRHRGPLGPVCLFGECQFPHLVGLHHRCRHGRLEPDGRVDGGGRGLPKDHCAFKVVVWA